MELRFTSGQICNIFNMTKQTLLFYDKMDILKPKYVDSSNGYRYYSLDQFDTLHLILSLKETGMPLKEMKAYLSERTVSSSISLLETQIANIQNKITHLESINKRLQKSCSRIKQVATIKELGQFSIKYVPEKYICAMPIEFVNGVPNFGLTLSKIRKHIKTPSDNCFWDVGAIGTFLPSDGFKDSEMFVEVDSIFEDEYFKIKPAGNYLCTYHQGPYETLDTSYANLFAYMKLHSYARSGEVYESYLVDILNTDNKSNFITELSVLI